MPEITLPAAVDSIQEAMQFVHEQLGTKYLNIIPHVELAVEELLVNVANYAYTDASKEKTEQDNKLLLGCRWVNMDGCDQFCVWIRDWGHPFDPFRNVATPDTSLSIDERDFGGLGLHFIKHVSNHYVYSGTDGSNTVELYFKAE